MPNTDIRRENTQRNIGQLLTDLKILVQVEGVPSSGNTPVALVIYTRASGADRVSPRLRLASDGGVFVYDLKSGADQGAAGAAPDELWIDTSDQTLKVGKA